MPPSTIINPPPALSALATQVPMAAVTGDLMRSLRNKFTRSKKSKQDRPPTPLKPYETRSRMSFATNGTVSSSTTITTAATVHDDRMEVDQDIVDGFELVKGRSGNATGALDVPRVDARGVLHKVIVENLTREKVRLAADLDDARRALEEQKEDMSRTLEDHLADIQERDVTLQELNAKCKDAIETREVLREQLERSAATAAEHVAGVQNQAEEYIQAIRADMEKERKEGAAVVKAVGEREKRIKELEQKFEEVKKLLAFRTEELKIAQRFMSTGDSLSVNDIAREVDELNEDIYQCAITIADDVIDAGTAGELSVEVDDVGLGRRLEEARGKLSGYFGEDLLQRLHADVVSGETLLFECLVQNILVQACEDVINHSWHGNSEVNKFFEEVWTGVSDKYDAAIARSWLAMAHQQLKKRRLDNSPLMEDLLTLLDAVGLRRNDQDAAKISATLRTKVIDLTKQAQRIKEMVFEDVLSVTVEPFFVAGGASFDGMRMQNPYDSHDEPGQLVICSTSLGVVCGKNQAVREVVLKSKVLLLSSLDAELQPPV